MASNNHKETIQKVVVTVSFLALNCPSTFAVAWSKDQHLEEMPILYAGKSASLLTALGALVDDRIMWAGLLASIGLFGYTVLFYKSPNNQIGEPIIIGNHTPVIQDQVLTV